MAPSTHAAAAGELDVQAALRMQATAREDLPRVTPLHQPGAWMTQQSGPFQMPCAPALSPAWSLYSPAAGHPWQQTSHKPASHEWDAQSHLPGPTFTVKLSGPGATAAQQSCSRPASCAAVSIQHTQCSPASCTAVRVQHMQGVQCTPRYMQCMPYHAGEFRQGASQGALPPW